jgi:hypothetical protein
MRKKEISAEELKKLREQYERTYGHSPEQPTKDESRSNWYIRAAFAPIIVALACGPYFIRAWYEKQAQRERQTQVEVRPLIKFEPVPQKEVSLKELLYAIHGLTKSDVAAIWGAPLIALNDGSCWVYQTSFTDESGVLYRHFRVSFGGKNGTVDGTILGEEDLN